MWFSEMFDKVWNTNTWKKISKFVYWISVSIAMVLWFSSCNKSKSDFSEYYPKIELTVDSIKIDKTQWEKIINVDVTWWSKKIDIVHDLVTKWYKLVIWGQVIAKRDKNCQYYIRYKEGQDKDKWNLLWKSLEIDEDTYVEIILYPLIDSRLISTEMFEKLKPYTITLRLTTRQEILISWLDKIKETNFIVGESYDLLKYIRPHNVSLEEITVEYPFNIKYKIEDRTNFIPNQAWENVKLKIEVLDNKWNSNFCIVKIKITPKDRESIESVFESPTVEEIFPNLSNELSDYDYKYVKQNILVLHQMIQSMLHHGTNKYSPEEIKERLNKTLIVFVWDKPNWDKETTWWNMLESQSSIRKDMLETLIPNANIENIKDDVENSWQLKIVKYAESHPEEIVMVCVPSVKNNDTESDYEKNVEELNKFNNVVILEEWKYSDISLAMLWMSAQLNPNIKDAKKLLSLSDTHLDKVRLLSIIKELMPDDLYNRINYQDNNTQYKLWKWEYPFIIFDIQWTMLEHTPESIPCDKEHGYILKDMDPSKYNQFFTKEKLIEWWHFSWENFWLWWKLIILNEKWERLMSIPVYFEYKNGRMRMIYN